MDFFLILFNGKWRVNLLPSPELCCGFSSPEECSPGEKKGVEWGSCLDLHVLELSVLGCEESVWLWVATGGSTSTVQVTHVLCSEHQ